MTESAMTETSTTETSTPTPTTTGNAATERPSDDVPRWRAVALDTKERFRADHTSITAAGVAFFGFLAMVPTFAAVISVYGLVADPDDVRTRMQELLSSAPPEMTELLTDQLTRLTETSSTSLGLGLLVSVAIALWSASSGMAHLLEGIGIAYDRSDDDSTPVQLRIRALLVTLSVVVIAAVGVAALGLAGSLDSSSAVVNGLVRVVSLLVVALLFLVVISVLYHDSAGGAARRWRWISPGAVLALVGWVLVTAVFGLYVTNFSSYDQTYGSLASIVILLLWLYLSSTVVLLGALLNSGIERHDTASEHAGPPRPDLIAAG